MIEGSPASRKAGDVGHPLYGIRRGQQIPHRWRGSE